MDVKQQAIDRLANSMRRFGEDYMRFTNLIRIDKEEAINNQDRAFESKLEAFHSLYDVTKLDFDYFKYGDTALLIVVRNAIHHRDHNLFHSWYKRLLTDGLEYHSGASYLFVTNPVCSRPPVMSIFYKLEDILCRLDEKLGSPGLESRMSNKNRRDLLSVISNDLQIDEIIKHAKMERYPTDQIYINFMPIFISAVVKVFTALKAKGVEFAGYDAEVYEKQFTSELSVDYSSRDYERVKIP